MTKPELVDRIQALAPWYHSIKLPHNITTPGQPYDAVWEITRKTRSVLDYKNKRVLDLASFDGMWAFDAESLGASLVVATDCNWEPIQRMLFCREQLNSKVIPFYNVPVQHLAERLDVYWKGKSTKWHGDNKTDNLPAGFDIVQHLGLFYHLIDPLSSLLQARSMLASGGHLLLETGYWLNDESAMLFNGVDARRIYKDVTTWWVPTLLCLKEMLQMASFEIVEKNILSGAHVGRVAIAARATPLSDQRPDLALELKNTYRNPGLHFV